MEDVKSLSDVWPGMVEPKPGREGGKECRIVVNGGVRTYNAAERGAGGQGELATAEISRDGVRVKGW